MTNFYKIILCSCFFSYKTGILFAVIESDHMATKKASSTKKAVTAPKPRKPHANAIPDEKKALALAMVQTGMNKHEVGRQLGITHGAICHWESGLRKTSDEVKEMKKNMTDEIADRLEQIAWDIASTHMSVDKLESSSATALATTLGILIDKIKVLRGQATNITEVKITNVESSLQDKLARVKKNMNSRFATPAESEKVDQLVKNVVND